MKPTTNTKKVQQSYSIPTSHGPLAVYHLNLMKYSDLLNLEEIVLLEKFMVLWKINRGKRYASITYSDFRLQKEIHIKRLRLASAVSKLVELGFIEIVPSPTKRVRKTYKLSVNKIVDAVRELYDFSEFSNPLELRDRIRIMEEYVRLYLTTHDSISETPQQIQETLGVDEPTARMIMSGGFPLYKQSII